MEYQFVYYNPLAEYENNLENVFVIAEISGDYLYIVIRIPTKLKNLFNFEIKIFKLNNECKLNSINFEYLTNNKCCDGYKNFQFVSYFNSVYPIFKLHNNIIQCTTRSNDKKISYIHYNYNTGIVTYDTTPKIYKEISCRKDYDIDYDDDNNILKYKLNNKTHHVNISENLLLEKDMLYDDDLFIYVNSQNHLIILFYSFEYHMIIIEEDKCLIEKKMDKEFNKKLLKSNHEFYPTYDDNFIVIILE